MQCYKCNGEIPDNTIVCPLCGAEMSEKAKIKYSTGEASSPLSGYTPMNWFKFLIYFMLFADAISAFVNAYNFISGNIYNLMYAGEYTAARAYADFGMALKITDILYALSSVIFGIFAIVCRYRLAKFKKDGPVYFYVAYTMNVVFAFAYCIAENVIKGIDYQAVGYSLFTVVPQLVFVYLNYVYFKKRKHLFKN